MKGLVHERRIYQTDEWYTPPEVFEGLKFPEFDLDPASPGEDKVSWIPAEKHYTFSDNGLNQKWEGRVWLNPPYGDNTYTWLYKLAQHGNGIALVFARTDTIWFHQIVRRASAVLFWPGRIKFIAHDGKRSGSPGCGSVLLSFGDECAEILLNSGYGWSVDNRKVSPCLT